MADFRRLTCPNCQGGGKVFSCARWTETAGKCCPEGTHRNGCLGRTVQCVSCEGAGIKRTGVLLETDSSVPLE